MKNVLITICGRAGSVGFPGKNTMFFCEKPLCNFSLAPADIFKESRKDLSIDVALNTDSEKLIDQVVSAYPTTTVLHREQHLANSQVPKMAVYIDSLNKMEAQLQKKYDYLIDLDITSPLRRYYDLLRQFETLEKASNLDLIFSVVKSRRNPFYNMAMVKDGLLKKVNEVSDYTARQQIEKLEIYDINASIYVFKAEFLRGNTTNFIWDAKCGFYEMFDTGILDIDSKEDFEMMQVVGRHLYAEIDDFKRVYDSIKQSEE